MERNTGRRKRKFQIMTLICSVVFLCCILWIVAYFAGLKRAEDELEAVRDSYVTQDDTGEEATTAVDGTSAAAETEASSTDDSSTDNEAAAAGESGDKDGEDSDEEQQEAVDYGVGDKQIDIVALQEEVNQDIYAWITVPGTCIDYPVLQHPEEMDYYLDYNLDGTKGYPGCIYTQRMNTKDWTDPNTVLYGHNMRNGTMFGDLHKFEDADFFEENKYIHIYTEDGRILVYEIFGAYVFSNAHLLMSYPVYTAEGFQSYLDSIFDNTGTGCHFREDVELTSEDKIITLSTCVRYVPEKRYLVQGVLVAEEEQP